MQKSRRVNPAAVRKSSSLKRCLERRFRQVAGGLGCMVSMKVGRIRAGGADVDRPRIGRKNPRRAGAQSDAVDVLGC